VVQGRIVTREETRHPVDVASVRTVEDAAADDEGCRRIRVDDFLEGFEVIRRPDVIVAQIRDPRPARDSNPFVMRRAVAATVLGQIPP